MKKNFILLLAAVMLAGFTSCNRSTDDEDRVAQAVNRFMEGMNKAETAEELCEAQITYDADLKTILKEEQGIDLDSKTISMEDEQKLSEFYNQVSLYYDDIDQAYQTALTHLASKIVATENEDRIAVGYREAIQAFEEAQSIKDLGVGNIRSRLIDLVIRQELNMDVYGNLQADEFERYYAVCSQYDAEHQHLSVAHDSAYIRLGLENLLPVMMPDMESK